MAARLLAHEVADLCLGKPSLKSLSISATIRHALTALKSTDDTHISIWSCDHHHSKLDQSFVNECRCLGKICMVDVICYLCKEENIKNPALALDCPVSVMLSHDTNVVRHVEPATSLVEAMDLIIDGAQNLVVPISSRTTINSKWKQNVHHQELVAHTTHAGLGEFCWLTQEDVIRFLLSSIGSFSPTAAYSVESLGIIDIDIKTVNYDSPALTAVELIKNSLVDQTSVAVTDDDGILIGEISPFTLAYCDETTAAAITTLSAGDLMAYIDCGGPPEDIVKLVEMRLKERNLKGMLDEFLMHSTILSSSSDDELSPLGEKMKSLRYSRSSSYSARITRRAEAIVCYPGSSLVAVMIQAVAHRVSYVWVIEEDCSVVGIVRFSGMLEVFRAHLESMMN
ncbi:Cystathionine beta-synthase, core [Artemisia annua]|uniref:Cystathionine beta-synthase, core n=1 Tax=Artemisia annua TaxID=35608 RepID=A0A2U1NS72_ARTAN|nr:Cystathionine beta-synthase, core [Artemisia annua]